MLEIMEHFESLNNVEIEVLDKKDKTKEQELTEELIQIIKMSQ